MARYWLVSVLVSVVVVFGAIGLRDATTERPPALPDRSSWPSCATAAPDPPSGDRHTLVVHDDTGEYAALAEVQAQMLADLATRFGTADVRPVSSFDGSGDHDAIAYVAGDHGATLPDELISEANDGTPILWLGDNLWQLPTVASAGSPVDGHDLRWVGDPVEVASVTYADQRLTVPEGTTIPLVEPISDDVEVLASARTEAGRAPYALRLGNQLWVAEAPFSDALGGDRYLVVADLLRVLHDVDVEDRRRALVRLEDIGPNIEPDHLRDAIDVLVAHDIPFSMAVYPVYRGALDEGDGDVTIRLRDRPEVVDAIVHGLDNGGTIVAHGYTHQTDGIRNPLSGRSGDDFEFFVTHFEGDDLIYDGPIPEDSREWVDDRLDRMLDELDAAGLPEPEMFEFPHYIGSAGNYEAVADRFAARYDNTHLFSSAWDGDGPASPHLFTYAAPHLIRDAYGSVVVPETLGYIDASAEPGSPGSAEAVIAGAAAQRVVRDPVIGFFFHPFLGTERLETAIRGIEGLGYEFVAPCEL